MSDQTILDEIKQSFISNVKKNRIIEDEDTLIKFSQLLNAQEIPSTDQLKEVLFTEELS